MELIAVVNEGGERYELTLTVPDSRAAGLDHGDVRERLGYLLQRDVERAAVVVNVAHRDAAIEREQQAQHLAKGGSKGGKKPPAQVAFAGTDESIELDDKGNEVARTKGGKRTLTKGGKG